MAFLLFFRNVKKKKKTKNPNRRNPGARPEGRGRRLSTLIQTAGYIEENRKKKRNRAISSHVPLGGVETTCCQRLVRASAGQFTSENKRIKSVGREKLTYELLLSYNNIRKTIESSTGEDIGVCWLFASQVRRRRPCQVAACQTVGAGSTLKRSLSLSRSVRAYILLANDCGAPEMLGLPRQHQLPSTFFFPLKLRHIPAGGIFRSPGQKKKNIKN